MKEDCDERQKAGARAESKSEAFISFVASDVCQIMDHELHNISLRHPIVRRLNHKRWAAVSRAR